MSATRNEIGIIAEKLTSQHRHEALALASMVGFFFHAIPAADHPKRDCHMLTLWTCVQAEMDRLGLKRADVLAAGASIRQANETLAVLQALDD